MITTYIYDTTGIDFYVSVMHMSKYVTSVLTRKKENDVNDSFFSIDLCHSNNDSFNKINIKFCFEWFLANDMNSKADSSLSMPRLGMISVIS